MSRVVASWGIIAALALCCWGQEPEGAATENSETSDAQMKAAVLEAREAALEARDAARAAQLALERSKGTSTMGVAKETPQTRRWRKAISSANQRRARLESQRWRRESAARPTVYVNPLSYPGSFWPGHVYTSITRAYSPYAPSVVVPVHRPRYQYSWYYE